MPRAATFFLALASVIISYFPSAAEEPAIVGGRVHNLKVLSDKVDDVTTAENILRSFCRPGMSDAERARALWIAAVRYRHQTTPPNEDLAADWEAHDPVKLFNVYGYCMCCCSSAVIESLNRLDGRQARGRILNGHSVPEVSYDGAWHMYDASLLTWFPKPETGVAASVDEIAGAVADWYARNPGYRGNGAKLDELMRSDQWMGWKKGPPLLAHCPYYTLGWFPARTHGWNATMFEYDRKPEIYEYGYHVGHRALFSLRPGERFVREAGNRGLHVNMKQDPNWDGLRGKAPEADLVYVKEFFPGYNGGVVGNGYHRYAPDLAAGGLAAGAEVYENWATGQSPALHPRSTNRPAVAVIPLTSPYVYLGGHLTIKAVRQAAADRVSISISTNNARTFAPIWTADKLGPAEAVIDLKDRIFRRYAYWLKVEITGASPTSAGLDALAVANDIQHAPRTLPWLGKGANRITVAADQDPTVATRAFTGRITPDARFSRNESTFSLGVTFDNLKVEDGSCWWQGGTGTMTVPVETPGEIIALRASTQIRARDGKDLIRILLSGDDGRTWRESARIAGPTPGRTEYFSLKGMPVGVKKILVRYELSGNNTAGILSFRIDADYKDPAAGRTFQPFQIVYRWKEDGQTKQNTTRIARLPFRYAIETGAVPEMVSVSHEMPGR
jgi:hypothetical protein